MRRLLLAVVVACLVLPAGAARGGLTFSLVPGPLTLPDAVSPNVSSLGLAPSWTTPPAQPAQLSSDRLLELWQGAGQAYGVPWAVLAAINKIESNFGRNMGPSSAGAIGWMQFMPSTWLRWGVDADGDGVADPWSPVDAIYSAARYLAASGAGSDIRQAVFSYNHAGWYVNEVMQLAQLYGGSGGLDEDAGVVFALDRLQASLSGAQATVAKASDAYEIAVAKAEALASREQKLRRLPDAELLLSDRLEAQKTATQAGAAADAAQAEADRLARELDGARAKLGELQSQAQAASFNRPAAQILTAPVQGSGSGDYVFPVGGGPTVVAVSHVHHDYPAADIAAPEGSPAYALSDGTVLYAWAGDARCGTGFTIETTDGQTWTYCHLSYLEPSVSEGMELRAGDPVGLVGATGNATGPHLHLQLQPADAYPQDEQWFQSFAGTAFQWSDEAPTKPGSSGDSARLPHRRAVRIAQVRAALADEMGGMIQLATVLLRGVVATFVGLLIAGGTLTLAADRAGVQRPTLVAAASGPRTLTVPQVTGQAYVFAKGTLQGSGFAWQVVGPVKGFAANTVADQQPVAGSVVLDTGAPTVTLTLARDRSYREKGTPENGAPYAGTKVRLPGNGASPVSAGVTAKAHAQASARTTASRKHRTAATRG